MAIKAKEYLKEIRKIDKIKEKRNEEIKQAELLWNEKATNITSSWGGDKVQSSGNPQKMESAICNKDYYLTLVNERIKELTDKRERIIRDLEKLNSNEYELLYDCYVFGKSLKEISIERACEYSGIVTLHGNALKSLQNILDKREKDNESINK